MDIGRSAVERLLALVERWEAFRPDVRHTGAELALELRRALAEITNGGWSALELLIHCPRCLKQHIDEGEFATKPHKIHACQFCGLGFAASKEPSVGVQFFSGWKNPGVKTEPTGDPPYISPGVIPAGMELTARVGEHVRVFRGPQW